MRKPCLEAEILAVIEATDTLTESPDYELHQIMSQGLPTEVMGN